MLRAGGSPFDFLVLVEIMQARLIKYLKRTLLLLAVVGATLLGVRAWDSQRGV